jgi:hypothetical protein
VERKTLLVEPCRNRGGDHCLALECLALVTKVELSVRNPRVIRSLLRESVLHFEQVGKVACRIDPDRQVDRLRVMIEDRQLLVKAVAHGATAHH